METKPRKTEHVLADAFPVPGPLPGWHLLGSKVAGVHPVTIKWRMAQVGRLFKVVYYVMMCVMLGWIGSQVFDRAEPTKVELQLITPQVKLGDEVRMKVNTFRYRVCSVDLNWVIFDGIHQVHPFGPIHYPATGDPGVFPPYIRGFKVPDTLAPGNAQLKITRSYSCPGNYLQEWKPIEQSEKALDFVILNKDGSLPPPPDNGIR